MDTLRQDLRYAARALLRRPGFSLVAILTLALGIGATTAMFSVVRGILLRPLPYPESDRLVTIWETEPEGATSLEGGLLSHADFRDVRAEVEGIESIALVNGANLTVEAEVGALLVRGGLITSGFFEVFRTPPVRGRGFTEEESRFGGPAVAVVGWGYWRDRLGAREDVIGSSLRIDGETHRIVGVAPPGFDYPGDAHLWVPAQNDEEGCGRGCVNRGSVARLAPGTSLASVRSELQALAARLEAEYPDTNANTVFAAAGLRDVQVGDVRPALWILLAAVGMVLLIACANVANLVLVRGRKRLAEIAVRTTLGAARGRLLRHLMTESGLLALVGGLAGLALAALGLERMLALAPANLPRVNEVALDPWTFGFAGVLVVVTTILFGLAPAAALARVDLTSALRAGGRGDVTAGATARGRGAILAAEVALSVMLLVGAGLMIRSLAEIAEVRPGYELEGVTMFRLSLPGTRYSPDARVRLMEELETRLEGTPGMEEVAVMVAPPLSSVSVGGGFTRTERPAPDAGDTPSAGYRVMGGGAPEILRVPVLAGRSFRPSDQHEAQAVVLLNRTAADRYFPGEDPVGRQIRVNVSTGYEESAPRTIVGVLGDFRGVHLTRPPQPEMYVPYAQAGAGFPHVLMRGPDPATALEAARRELASLDPQLPMIQPGTLGALADEQLAQPRFYLWLLGLFAALAVLLAAVGIYGVVAYAVSLRTREIGVRMALGARVPHVVRLVLWQGMRPAAWGVGLGVLGAIWGGGALRGLLYEVAPQDPATLVAVPLFVVIIVAVACAVPALRASRIPPAIALESE